MNPLTYAYGIFLLALVSPGPDFAITVRNSLTRGLKAGLLCALGITIANSFHISVVSLGMGALITSSPYLYRALLWAAAAYLAYIGVNILKSTIKPQAVSDSGDEQHDSGHSPLVQGFFVSILNAKALIFWLSFFTLALGKDVPPGTRWAFIGVMIATITGWFSFVGLVLSQPKARSYYLKHEALFNRLMALVLLGLSVRVVLSA